MKVYDTLLIGCSYASVGYALNSKNTLIVEQTQSADTRFYLPLKNYNLDSYTPTTEHGKSLFDTFNSFKLIDGERINANGLESAFCDFLCKSDLEITFKSRVIDVAQENDLYIAKIITNGGIITVKTKKIIDTTVCSPLSTTLTVMVKGELTKDEEIKIKNAFGGATIQNTFYKDVYAVFLQNPNGLDYNAMLDDFYNKWKTVGAKVKTLYVAPTFSKIAKKENGFPKDEYFGNPIEAFENGYYYAQKGEN